MKLKELRMLYRITQERCAEYLGIPLRTYKRYESDETKIPKIKYDYILKRMDEFNPVDEEHGVLTVAVIKEVCKRIFEEYPVKYCYLFGSYSKGKAKETSDVDLLISTEITGLKFFGLVEELRVGLKKKVDVLNQDQIKNNYDLTNEILSDGVKIYG